jgi:hypothetical protein
MPGSPIPEQHIVETSAPPPLNQNSRITSSVTASTAAPSTIILQQPQHSLIESFSGPVSWALVIFGWIIVSRDSDWREHRREVRATYAELTVLGDKVERSSHQYYQLAATDPNAQRLAMEIKRDLDRLGMQIEMLRMRCSDIECKSELTAFRQSVTGGNFEVASRKVYDSDSAKLYEISLALDDLYKTLDSKIERRFSKSRWRIWLRLRH